MLEHRITHKGKFYFILFFLANGAQRAAKGKKEKEEEKEKQR